MATRSSPESNDTRYTRTARRAGTRHRRRRSCRCISRRSRGRLAAIEGGEATGQSKPRCSVSRAGSYRPRIGILEWQRVEALIRREWSPVQVRDRLAEEGQRPISHERIYQHLCQDKLVGGTLYRFLRCQRLRRKRYGRPERRGQLINRVSIEDRPAIVERRSRIGDWEGDTLIGR